LLDRRAAIAGFGTANLGFPASGFYLGGRASFFVHRVDFLRV
jgi:hypothetical protein